MDVQNACEIYTVTLSFDASLESINKKKKKRENHLSLRGVSHPSVSYD